MKTHSGCKRRYRLDLLLLVLTVGACATTKRDPKPRTCMYGAWSQPVPLSDSLPTAVFRFPSLAAGSGDAFVVGNDIALFDSQTVRPNPLVAARLGGSAIGHPPGEWNFAFPRAAVDALGTLHLLWGEPDGGYQSVAAYAWPNDIVSIWHASYEPARGWSPAHELSRMRSFDWDEQLTPAFSVASTGDRLSLSTLGSTRVLRDTPVVFVYADGRWSARRLQTDVPMLYSASAITPEHLYFAYVGVTGVTPTSTSVFVQRSDDEGLTWRPAGKVSASSRGGRSSEVKVLTAGDEYVFVTWIETTPKGSAIRLALSKDRGITWAQTSDLDMGYEVRSLQASVDSCRALHVVVDHWDTDGANGHLDYASWAEKWSPPSHLFPYLRASGAALGIGPNGRPMLAFVAQGGGSPETAPLTSLQSTLGSGKRAPR